MAVTKATPVNFRDLGGMTGYAGKRVKPNRLYRGGQLYEMSDLEKKEFCSTYHIDTIIDLRNKTACDTEPDGEIPGVSQHIFEVMQDMKEQSQMNPMWYQHAEGTDDYMGKIYAGFITNKYANKCFHDIVELLSTRTEGGAYIHCHAGKDRTGIILAIILTILGASREDILTDYLLTIESRKEENKRLMKEARKSGKTEEEIHAMSIYLSVRPHWLETSFNKAEELYGSFMAYIEKGIGIQTETMDRIRSSFLV
ncbi:protein-tyrosine phosphatase [Anaerotaenia torta]|uniref:tyrosine-protein phosphatase n=1 Tax=Anaerotaenia torta TaxID=433293 RepID=UPI003D257D56